jgi:short-subunit dehydrogenase
MRAIITGASSGIGAALARELSRRGWSLGLVARRGELLEELAAELPNPAAALPCDVADDAAVKAAVARGEEALGGPFDLAVANAGIGLPSWADRFKFDDAELMVRVNIIGTLALFDAVIPGMVARRAGRFAGIASIAGLRGLPSATVYAATKAFLQSFLEGSRVELAPHGVAVTIVNPGFVATPMTVKNKKMPFLMQPEEAARRIADGLERGKRVVEFPWQMSLFMRLVRLLPDAVYDRLMVPYGQRDIDVSKGRR